MASNGNDNFGKAQNGKQPWNWTPQPWKPIQQGGTAVEQFGGKGVRAGLSRMQAPQLQKVFSPMSNRIFGK